MLGYVEEEGEVVEVEASTSSGGGIVGLVPLANGTVQCLTCGKTLATIQSAKRHYKLVHATDMSDKRYQCEICHSTFAVESYKNDHMRVIHGITQTMLKNRVMPENY